MPPREMVEMIVLAPLLSGKEAKPEFINAVAAKADKVILLQIVDRDFMNKTSAAMGEVMHYSSVMRDAKKAIGAKKKSCDEITEWGGTVQKILSIALLQKVDKVALVSQRNKFFDEVLEGLRSNKIEYELIDVPDEVPERKKKIF